MIKYLCRKSFRLWYAVVVLFVLCGIQVNAQSVIIGTGSVSTAGTGADPIDGYFNYFRYQVVYTAAELLGGGMSGGSTITALGWEVSQAYGAGALPNYEIRMGHTSVADAAAHVVAPLTTVKLPFSYTPVVQSAGSFQMITFDTPFIWDGTSNIVIDICAGSNPFTSPYGGVMSSSLTNGARFKRCDGCGSQCSATTNSVLATRPNIKFDYTPGLSCSGVPDPATASGPPDVCSGQPFNLNATGFSTGANISYQWEVFNANTSLWDPLPGGNSPSFTVTSGQTTANDYRLVTTCSNGGGQDVSNTVSILMSPFYNCYCSSGATNAADGEITNVTLGPLNNSSTCAASNQTYTDFSGTVVPVSLTQAGVYPVSVTAGSCGGAYVGYVKIFIDFDQDGTFTGPGEEVFAGVPPGGLYTPGGILTSGVVSIPVSAVVGLTRMRVILQQTSTASAVLPCGTYNYGETEDYLVDITAAQSCSGTPSSVSASGPTSVCPNTGFGLSASNYSMGLNLSYEWQFLNSATSTWDPVPGGVNPLLSIAGITTATDYRFVTTCSNGGGQDISNTVSVSIASPTQCYCIPTYTNGGSADFIAEVVLGTMSNNTLSAGNVSPYYVDFTSQQPSTIAIPDLAQGLTYNLSVTFGGDANQYNGVWVDFDQDGIFATTEYFTSGTNTAANGTVSIPIAVPIGALLGNTRMRIRGADDSQPTSAQACGASSSTYGEAEDYTVNIISAPSCLPPTALTAGASTPIDAVVSWTASISLPANGYEYYHSTSNVAPTATTVATGSVGSNVLSATIPGLTPATTYYVWVRSFCGPSDFSPWSGPITVVTQCGTITAPYTYDVETQNANTNSVMVNCWTTAPTNSTSSYAWHVTGNGATPSTSTGPSSANSGSKYFFTEASNGVSGAVAELITPFIDVTPLSTPQLEFYYHMYGSAISSLEVSVWDGTMWVVVDVLNGPQQTAETDPWVLRSIPLIGFSDTIRIKFKAVRGGSFEGDISIDDISVIQAPACVQPAGLGAGSLTATSANVTWGVVPGAVDYEYTVDQTGTPAPGGSSVIYTSMTNTPLTFTGLSGGNTYYLHVRSNCGSATGFSTWAVYSFSTPPPNDSCVNAVDISGQQVISGSTTGATESEAPCDATATANDVWYSFTTGSIGGSVTITVVTTGVMDVVMQGFSGTCGSLTAMVPTASTTLTGTCIDGPAAGSEFGTYTVLPNTTYYVRVYGFSMAEGSFTIQAIGNPLAIKLDGISATNFGFYNRIDWNTASEASTDKFELQRSADGASFTTITTLTAQGRPSTYSYFDEQPIKGLNYYRLKLIERNGGFMYSPTVHAKTENLALFNMEVYPNPVTNVTDVIVSSPGAGSGSLTVVDLTGKVLFSTEVAGRLTTIDMGEFASGVYLVNYRDEKVTRTVKVVKK